MMALSCLAAENRSRCTVQNATNVQLYGPKVVLTSEHPEGKHASVWYFDAPSSVTRITVTPAERSMDPDISLFARTAASANKPASCLLVASAQDYGGDLLVVNNKMTQQLNATQYFLRVWCHYKNCFFHVAFTLGDDSSAREEIKIGETKSGIAYRGVPLHFFFDCQGTCAESAAQGTNRRLTFSVWPRDATSVHHLTLLVRKDAEPSTAADEHLRATRGWFSGEVVGTAAEAGRFHITVLKRHGRAPMPFVLSLRLPETVQQIPLGKPFFGAVGRNQMAFYTFQVREPNTDIEVYLTKLDGDPDVSVSHSKVDSHPTPLHAQWHSRKEGDDEIVIQPDDPKRQTHPTGWFNVGVHGYKHTAFSLIVLAEPHVTAVAGDSTVIDWTELWLGLPQTRSAWPGHPGMFIFYSQLVTPRLFVQVQAVEGEQPDACMSTCGSDPHMCRYISAFAPSETQSKHPKSVVSTCNAARLKGANGDTQATIAKPCSSCWYALLVTSESAANRSSFRVTLGAEGRAHPLIAGESFRGHVDARDTAVLLVYDISAEEVRNQTKANATLRFVMTTIYGDPMFSVHSGAEDGPVMFSSNVSGRDDFSVHFKPGTAAPQATTYYLVVWAASKHAQFRMQVSWDLGAANLSNTSVDSLEGLGISVLRDGKAQNGVVEGTRPFVYLYDPLGTGTAKPDIRVMLRAAQKGSLGIYVVPVRTGRDHSKLVLASALAVTYAKVQVNAVAEGWVALPGASMLTIAGSDPRYVLPGSGDLYAVAVFPANSGNSSARRSFTIEVSKDDSLHELLATGVPIPGAVKAGEYIRYRLVVSEPDRHLGIMLKASSGDADIFVGLNASVGREASVARSELDGSDSIFLEAFSPVNAEHCSEGVIQARGECVYFVAVLGKSLYAEYELSAVVPAGRPVQLSPSSDLMTLVPPNGRHYLTVRLEPSAKPMTLQVAVLTGSLGNVTAKVMSRTQAQHPSRDLVRLAKDEADLGSRKFAGVWSIRLEPAKLRELCKAVEDASGCAALVVLWGGLMGTVAKTSLQVDTAGSEASDAVGAPPPDHTPPGYALPPAVMPNDIKPWEVLMLEAGVPMRGSLRNATTQLLYGFEVQDTSSDLAVSLTALTNCTPLVQLVFPQSRKGGKRSVMTFKTDLPFGFVSRRVPHTDRRFRPGLYLLRVKQYWPARCEFDLRAQLEVASSVAELGKTGVAMPTTLLLNAPVLETGDKARYFIFTSKIDKAEDAAKRENLEIRVTSLTGEIQVRATILNGTTREALAGTLSSAHEVVPEGTLGTSRVFSYHSFREGCGEVLQCQVLLGVRSAREGRFVDFMAVATDTSQGSAKRSEVLLFGIPAHGCVGSACPNKLGLPVQYQLFVNNPTSKVRVRLSCQGTDRAELCTHVQLSADARPALPESPAERAYRPISSQAEGELELEVQHVSNGTLGQCHAPCVLLISVEAKPGSKASVLFELSAASDESYVLLVDGGEPVSRVAEPSRPEYFLFDSRRSSPLLTLTVTVPYDSIDPHAELVSMYVLDCDMTGPSNSSMRGTGRVSGSKLSNLATRPSAENYRYKSVSNSRGQLVTFIARGPAETSEINEGGHCYYRVAVISHRLRPLTFTIRGFDWHPAAPLVLGEPLEGLVDFQHSFTYKLQSRLNSTRTALPRKVMLSMEVCSGLVRLRTARQAKARVSWPMASGGGLPPTLVRRKEHAWLEVTAGRRKYSSYILTAEDPHKRVWLMPKPNSQLMLFEEGRAVTLVWSIARLFGAGQPKNGRGSDLEPAAEYEVFYAPVGNLIGNSSTACGLYLDYRFKRIKRIFTKTNRTATIRDLEHGSKYVFNVVARSVEMGQSVAYTPYQYLVTSPEALKTIATTPEVGRGLLLEQVGPFLVIGLSLVCVVLGRPCCKGEGLSWQRLEELELPRWEGRARSRNFNAYNYAGNDTGTYAPPSVVGQGVDIPYSQVR